MHDSVQSFVADALTRIKTQGARVLEVGSYNENGSVRHLFEDAADYIGIDSRRGPGVDFVMDAHMLEFPQGYFRIETDKLFDIVVSTEMLEHDSAFWLSLPEMGRVLKPGGYLILTARGIMFPVHGFPSDYWRFTAESFRLLFALANCAVLKIQGDTDPRYPGVFGVGRKKIYE